MQGFFDFVKSLGAARMAAMAAVTLALIGFFSFLMIRMTTPQMVPLFTDLSLDNSASIAKDLDRQGVTYEIKNNGTIILVPRDKVARLRMKEAENGLPKGGGVGYEIFDKSDALGATTFIQNINKLRALEGELSRTIRSLDRVEAARVHLVLPDRPLFSREKVEASASIVLKVRGTLRPSQVRAIRHLVASAVTGLKPERISIVDETGKLLADGAGDDNALTAAGADERKIAFESRLRKEVENIVTSVVGPGRARVQITADFDLNRITQTSDKYDPDGRVVRSSQTREEKTSNGGGNGGAVSVGNELPRRQGRRGNGGAPRPEQQERGNRQLRDFAHHQDRSDRGRPRQAHFRRRPGRRHLQQERQGRDGLQAAAEGGDRPHRRAGALGHRLRRQARRPGRGGQSALRRDPGDADQRADRLDELSAVHQGRHHARRQDGRDGRCSA